MDTKKAWKRRLSVPRVEALALPSKLNRQRQSPRRTFYKSPYALNINTYYLLSFISDTFMFPNFIGGNEDAWTGR